MNNETNFEDVKKELRWQISKYSGIDEDDIFNRDIMKFGLGMSESDFGEVLESIESKFNIAIPDDSFSEFYDLSLQELTIEICLIIDSVF